MCLCVGMCVPFIEFRDARPPEGGVTGGCEMPNMDAGNQNGSFLSQSNTSS